MTSLHPPFIAHPDRAANPPAVTFMKNSRFYVAGFVGLVVLALLCLSLSHLASGLQKLTGDSVILSMCLAIGIDMGILGAELALIVAALENIQKVKLAAISVLSTSLVLSALLNGLSYTAGTEPGSFEFYLTAILGAWIPFAVLCLSKVSASLVIGKKIAANVPGDPATVPATPATCPTIPVNSHHAAAIAAHPPAFIEARSLHPKKAPTKQALRRRKARSIIAKLPAITNLELAHRLGTTEKTATLDRKALEAMRAKRGTSRTSVKEA